MQHATLLSALLLASPAAAQATEVIAAATSTDPIGSHAREAAVSGNGRFVAFASTLDDLVPGDTNGEQDVFVVDLATNVIERVSTGTFLQEGDGASNSPEISHDGSKVVFTSFASNLIEGDTNGVADVFVKDRLTGELERVSVTTAGDEAQDFSASPAIDAGGTLVTFRSHADNFFASGNPHVTQIWGKDLSTGELFLVSHSAQGVQGDHISERSAISADGRFIAFESRAENLVSDDANGVRDVFVYEVSTDTVTRVSESSFGTPATLGCYGPSISGDGRRVSFYTASALAAGDTNDQTDVYVKELDTGACTRISVTEAGAQVAEVSSSAQLAADADTISFVSFGALVPEDQNGIRDIYRRHLVTGALERLSILPDGSEPTFGSVLDPSVSADGQVTSFTANLWSGSGFQYGVVIRNSFPASWANYGEGHPGTAEQVPSLTLSHDPVPASEPTVLLGNPTEAPTIGFLLVGATELSLKTSAGGTLLVLAEWIVPTDLGKLGAQFPIVLPDNPNLLGQRLLVQAVIADGAASHGFAFSRGLEIVFGH